MTSSSPSLAPVLEQADRTLDAALERLFTFLRIPSISTQPEHADDCRRAAAWLRDQLDELGFDVTLHATPGHPILVAHDRTPPAGPHVLFYGHYDVQPVDPLNLWDSGPFEPKLVTGTNGAKRIVARGASDDKGQVMTFIEAIRAIRATTGTMPVRISLLIEGEEECGGPSLVPFMDSHRDELRADVGLICDTAMLPGVPAVTTTLRGMLGEEIHLRCASRDLHSGVYGNAARNPAELLCGILSSIRDGETGRVVLPGFYTGVEEPPAALRARWREIAPDDATFLGEVGLSVPVGEKGYTAIEQTWCRPSFEINGISSGYTGEGFKTVLPGEAVAKVSFRLVAGQDPVHIRQAFCAHVRAMLPADCTVTFTPCGGSTASALPDDAFGLQPTLRALGDEWNTPAVTIGCGGSIPVAGDMQRILGMPALLVGFALDDDRAHSPNEKYELTSFHKGMRSWVRILHAMVRHDG
ncbi:M20/M25/M40 family metallo-hydrolase [Komagataeibacter sp. FNDCF1]|uniref:M20/M25/M40 family metallo-hydrolase n=1 Tax=Komagataeibacter sp. FNDCF1 TaxID=2878681 RepID=UPI001E480300|nr:M20/M25/M40 family metallo-hydrolase [Komagataeibacter sp. FNDCF1]MCE2565444.1 M20/M25/M40 family metallo-hydrolase [Komagataeibacter sp. FNDCF1]